MIVPAKKEQTTWLNDSLKSFQSGVLVFDGVDSPAENSIEEDNVEILWLEELVGLDDAASNMPPFSSERSYFRPDVHGPVLAFAEPAGVVSGVPFCANEQHALRLH